MKDLIISILDDMRLLWMLWSFSLGAFLLSLLAPALLVTLVAGFHLVFFLLTGTILTIQVLMVVKDKGEVDRESLFMKDARLFRKLLTKEVNDGPKQQGQPEQRE